mmetsp:Transcript_49230/g.154636  ORF Transcript_49230/g.154636 Transcript_49230/m.154636 type:complete len:269 (+) Transcript_49230:1943-2749(+)
MPTSSRPPEARRSSSRVSSIASAASDSLRAMGDGSGDSSGERAAAWAPPREDSRGTTNGLLEGAAAAGPARGGGANIVAVAVGGAGGAEGLAGGAPQQVPAGGAPSAEDPRRGTSGERVRGERLPPAGEASSSEEGVAKALASTFSSTPGSMPACEMTTTTVRSWSRTVRKMSPSAPPTPLSLSRAPAGRACLSEPPICSSVRSSPICRLQQVRKWRPYSKRWKPRTSALSMPRSSSSRTGMVRKISLEGKGVWRKRATDAVRRWRSV